MQWPIFWAGGVWARVIWVWGIWALPGLGALGRIVTLLVTVETSDMAQVFLNGGNVDSSGRGINSLATMRTSTLLGTTTRVSRGVVGVLSLLFGLRVSRVLGKRGFVLFGRALATGTSGVNLPSAGGRLDDSLGFCIDSFFNYFVPGVEIPTAFI